MTSVTAAIFGLSQAWMRRVSVPLFATMLGILSLTAPSPSVLAQSAEADGIAIEAEDGKQLIVANTELEFAQWIIRLISDESLRERVGLAGRQFVAERLSWERQNKKLDSLFIEEDIKSVA